MVNAAAVSRVLPEYFVETTKNIKVMRGASVDVLFPACWS